MKLNKNVLSDRTLKIISLIIAIGLWLYVIQVQSPDVVRTVKNVPVVFSQKDVLENRGLILIDDNEHTVDVKIKGIRRYAYDVNQTNITVIADVSNLDKTGRHTLQTNVVLPYGSLEILDKNPSILPVTVDELMKREFDVTVMAVGSPKSDYITGNTQTQSKKITVKGPKSIVAGIEKVAAVLDVSGKSSDVAANAPLTLFGSNDKEIQSPYLSLSTDSIDASCEILKTKEVNIVPTFSGNVDNALKYLPDSNNVKTVRIAGAPETIDEITEIQTKPISEYDIGKDGNAMVRLSLPKGVRSLDGESFTFRFSSKIETAE